MTGDGLYGIGRMNRKACSLRRFARQWDDYTKETRAEDTLKFNQTDADYVLSSFNMARGSVDRYGQIAEEV